MSILSFMTPNNPPEPPAFVCEDKEATQDAIAAYGRAERRVQEINVDINRQVAALSAPYEGELATLKERKAALAGGIRAWCEDNKTLILPKGRKTARFLTGEVAWRAGSKTVEVTGEAQGIIALFKKKRLKRFVETKESIKKAAILQEPERIQDIEGIAIRVGEEAFAIRPFDMAADQAA
uniref:Mu-like prophage host-nuclease inhibitor protein Gam n=1 Tax=Candidatus Kentrum sp. UNK TaxID=2126344 RepID=A0A451B2S5_9GAMM|nr:MAG: Mu-like prophage host-nuclease inhibitor protein Gam [Candidatus Kentron sp. UNK]VFK72589.1 MAG: Mu-like prophage host-nuclease inhibitor protein Gam [Candidatus Kentron sp. UNK]